MVTSEVETEQQRGEDGSDASVCSFSVWGRGRRARREWRPPHGRKAVHSAAAERRRQEAGRGRMRMQPRSLGLAADVRRRADL